MFLKFFVTIRIKANPPLGLVPNGGQFYCSRLSQRVQSSQKSFSFLCGFSQFILYDKVQILRAYDIPCSRELSG